MISKIPFKCVIFSRFQIFGKSNRQKRDQIEQWETNRRGESSELLLAVALNIGGTDFAWEANRPVEAAAPPRDDAARSIDLATAEAAIGR